MLNETLNCDHSPTQHFVAFVIFNIDKSVLLSTKSRVMFGMRCYAVRRLRSRYTTRRASDSTRENIGQERNWKRNGIIWSNEC